MSVPPWLERLLATAFFSTCRTHGVTSRNECNMYCLDCNDQAFCYYCRSSFHKDHQVIQVRRSSYHDVVRVAEIQKVLDISEIQTYVINSARVLFLNERPQPKSAKGGVGHTCEVCGRSLLDTFRFCSLGCKLAGIKKYGNANLILLEDKHDTLRMERTEGNSRRAVSSSHSNARRRKGIPRRAPFRS